MSSSNVRRRTKKDLQLFDPITCEKKKTSYELLLDLTGMSIENLRKAKFDRRFIKSIGCYIIDSKFTSKDLIYLIDKIELDTEVWRNIDEDGTYQVSTFGRIRKTSSTRKPEFLIPYQRKHISNKLAYVKTMYKGKYIERPVHRLVGEAFVPKEREDCDVIIHKNGNSLDNRVRNLKWVTKKEVAKIGRKSLNIPVLKLDPITLEVLDEFPSIKDAALSVYVVPETLRQCVAGINETAGGFRWKIYEEALDDYF